MKTKQVHAQRKYAQGAHIPISNPSTPVDRRVGEAGSQTTSKVFLNNNDAKNLLDIVSFSNIHRHTQPIVLVKRLNTLNAFKKEQAIPNHKKNNQFIENHNAAKFSARREPDKETVFASTLSASSNKKKAGRPFKFLKKRLLSKKVRRSNRLRGKPSPKLKKTMLFKKKIKPKAKVIKTKRIIKFSKPPVPETNDLDAVCPSTDDDEQPLTYFKTKSQQATAKDNTGTEEPTTSTNVKNKNLKMKKKCAESAVILVPITEPTSQSAKPVKSAARTDSNNAGLYYGTNGIERWISESTKDITKIKDFKVPDLPQKKKKIDKSPTKTRNPAKTVCPPKNTCSSEKFVYLKDVMNASQDDINGNCNNCTRCEVVKKVVELSKLVRDTRKTTRSNAIDIDPNTDMTVSAYTNIPSPRVHGTTITRPDKTRTLKDEEQQAFYMDLLPGSDKIVEVSWCKIPNRKDSLMSARLISKTNLTNSGDVTLANNETLLDKLLQLYKEKTHVDNSGKPTNSEKEICKQINLAKTLGHQTNKEITNKQGNVEIQSNKKIDTEKLSKQTHVEKVTSKQITLEKAESKQQTSEKSANKQTTLEKPTSKQTSVDKLTSQQTALEKSTSKQSSVDKPLSKQTSVGKLTSQQTAMEKSTSKQSSVDKPLSKQTSVDKPLSKQTSVDKPLSKQTNVDKPLSKQTSVDKHLSKQTSVDKPLRKQMSVDKSLDKQTTMEKSTSKQPTVEKTKTKQTTVEKPTGKQTTLEKLTCKQTTPEKPTNKQSSVEKLTSKQTIVEKSTSKQTIAEKSISKQTTAEKLTSKQTTEEKSTSKSTTVEKSTTKQTSIDKPTNKTTSVLKRGDNEIPLAKIAAANGENKPAKINKRSSSDKRTHPNDTPMGDNKKKRLESNFPRSLDRAKLVDAPVFYPTEAEFTDPISYFEKVMPVASQFGICKVVPPPDFVPACTLSDTSRFTVTNQYIPRLYTRWGPAFREMCAIRSYLASQKVHFTRAPLLEGLEVNLPKMYHTVQRLGGLKNVFDKKRWNRVAEEMHFYQLTNPSKKLEQIYVKYLLPYDTLTNRERQMKISEVEQMWQRKNKKMLARAINPLLRQQRLLGDANSESDSDTDQEGGSDSDEEVENTGHISDPLAEAEECIVPGRTMNLNNFEKVAQNAFKMYIPPNEEANTKTIENLYWKLVLFGADHVCVNSASVDTGEEGYGFTKNRNSPYGKHPWNLKVISQNNGNLLRPLGPVLGLTVPTLHLGMIFSTSCWHRDPHGLPWIEYMHQGPEKIWYGIPDEQSQNFRKAVEILCPTVCQNKGIWLSSDITMIPPNMLLEHEVSLSRITQRPHEFVIVFPKAYSSSICTGYTISESVYFATQSWLGTMATVFQELRESCEPTTFALEQLLIAVARDARSPLCVLQQVHATLSCVITAELADRAALKRYGLQVTINKGTRGKRRLIRHQDECEICRTTLYLSKVKGVFGKQSALCVQHALRVLVENKTDAEDKKKMKENIELEIFFTKNEFEEIEQNLQRRLLSINGVDK